MRGRGAEPYLEAIMTFLTRVLAVAWVTLTLGACAAGTSSATARDRNLITQDEIQSAQVRNALELIERVRPLWLQSRGERSVRLSTDIVVYQDGAMLGDTDLLRGIPNEIVLEVRSLDSAEAGRLPGMSGRHVERAIVVMTRRR